MTLEPSFRLCEACAGRQGGDSRHFDVVGGARCFICGGLMERLETIADMAGRDARGYDFRTFGVGVSMPPGVQEREDQVRSALQLKGERTIKAQLSAVLSASIAGRLGKKPDRENPDLTLLVDVGKPRVAIQSRSLYYFGRYTKPAGVAQRREYCRKCWGKGCRSCGRTGFDRTPTVEEKVGKNLMKWTAAKGARFTWIGSEDMESVVSGNGRPFVVELKNPRRRHVPRRFTAGGKGGRVFVTHGRALPSKPTRLPTFRFRTRISAEAGRKVGRLEMRELARVFRDATVVFDRPGERPVLKTVYRLRGNARGKNLVIDAELDGGLPVKRLVNGDLVAPSVSEVLKTEVKCGKFDIRGVKETGEFGFG